MKAWHFVPEDGRLRYGDNRQVEPGQTYTVPDDRPLELCIYGLHGSKRLLDALNYAPGPILCRVELIGKRIDGDDKSVAYRRRVLWMFDATNVLRDFARRCALDAIHLWNAPEIVVRYLKTGDESLRNVVCDAAWAGAMAAEATRAAAGDAARAAAWSAARAAAWAAAGDAARGAAWDKQNRRLTAMVTTEYKRLAGTVWDAKEGK